LVLERLMRYYRFLTESAAMRGADTVTSAQIAEALDIDPTQVRKDFGAIGILGMGRVGFEVCEVCRSIRVVLAFDDHIEAVLVGAGHLGSALLAYKNFERYGMHITAAFDSDKGRIGHRIAGRTVQSTRALKPYVKKHQIHLAILTTPTEVSQAVTDRLVSVGVRAIWNFSPTQLTVPDGVLVRNEHISIGLAELSYHLKR
jgi:redox-sensing transcriptional repressor